jgi:hypothetical protein
VVLPLQSSPQTMILTLQSSPDYDPDTAVIATDCGPATAVIATDYGPDTAVIATDCGPATAVIATDYDPATAVIATEYGPATASQKLQASLLEIQFWLNTWRMKAKETKSVHVTFTTRRATCPPVHMNDVQIPQEDHVKCLGLHLDRRLT